MYITYAHIYFLYARRVYLCARAREPYNTVAYNESWWSKETRRAIKISAFDSFRTYKYTRDVHFIKHRPAAAGVLFLKTGLFDPSACFLFPLLLLLLFARSRFPLLPAPLASPGSTRRITQALFNNVLHTKWTTATHTHARARAQLGTQELKREIEIPLEF